ncbi:metal ABC transporter permease [Sanguibacter sp. A247]|uniref:metal ABC transporter permease n=1 Tax=unclassified Sanguibacter TaxID=2645534 RepID=UPI003FD8EFFB
MTLLDLLVDPLAHEFMLRALAVITVSSAVCAVLSCWLVLVGWSLMGDAVSHAVLPGVVLAYLSGLPFALGAAVFALAAVGLVSAVRATGRTKEDAAIGIVFTTLFALGLVLVSVTPSQTDLMHVIFGNVLGVSRSELVQVAVLAGVVLVAAFARRHDLTLLAFDAVQLRVLGRSPGRVGALLLVLLALTSVTAIQSVGVVLIVALLVIPGATAHLLSDRLSHMLVIAPAIAVGCGIVGVYVSYYADLATGATVVLVQGLTYLLAAVAAPRRGLVARRRPRPTAA